MSREDNISAQEALGAAVNAHDLDGIASHFAEDVIDHDPAPDQGEGRAGIRDFWSAMLTGFPDAAIEPATLVADDENVVVAYTFTGTHDGEFQGLEPTGRRIEVRGVQIGRFEDGVIAERWGSSDELGIMKQLGAA